MVILNGDNLGTVVQEIADELSQDLGFQFKSTEFKNSLRFDDSGALTWKWGVKFSLPDLLDMRIWFTIKGPYFVYEDSGSSAIMSLSFTEFAIEGQVDGEDIDTAEDLERRASGLFGDLADDERASINGDQLRIGDSLFEAR